MRPTRRPLLCSLVSLAALLSAGCTVVDVRGPSDGGPVRGIRSEGLVEGYATYGWARDPSFLKLELLDGRSPGALASVDLWYLARVEVGLAGASVGVGPFDVGLGTLFYEPVSPAAPRRVDDEDWCGADDEETVEEEEEPEAGGLTDD